MKFNEENILKIIIFMMGFITGMAFAYTSQFIY